MVFIASSVYAVMMVLMLARMTIFTMMMFMLALVTIVAMVMSMFVGMNIVGALLSLIAGRARRRRLSAATSHCEKNRAEYDSPSFFHNRNVSGLGVDKQYHGKNSIVRSLTKDKNAQPNQKRCDGNDSCGSEIVESHRQPTSLVNYGASQRTRSPKAASRKPSTKIVKDCPAFSRQFSTLPSR